MQITTNTAMALAQIISGRRLQRVTPDPQLRIAPCAVTATGEPRRTTPFGMSVKWAPSSFLGPRCLRMHLPEYLPGRLLRFSFRRGKICPPIRGQLLAEFNCGGLSLAVR